MNVMKCHFFVHLTKYLIFMFIANHHLSLYLVQYIAIIYMFFLLELGISSCTNIDYQWLHRKKYDFGKIQKFIGILKYHNTF
jgi:hypothetical protein